MKRFSGFRMGNGGFLGKAFLGQPETEVAATAITEPDLAAATVALSNDEVQDYKNWGPREKTLFLQAYQYLAVASAKNLTRPDGTAFNGFFPEGLSQGLAILSAAATYVMDFDSSLLPTLQDLTNAVDDGNGKTLPTAQGIVSKYRPLRDRIAWEMAMAGVTVKFDVVGTDPSNPGVLYQRTIGNDGVPDLDVTYSYLNQAQMYQKGQDLESKLSDAGVAFQMAGASLGAVAFPILAVIIVAVVGILSFFALYWNHKDRQTVIDQTVDFVNKNPNLTPEQRAAILGKLADAQSFFGQIFPGVPWTALLVSGAIILISIFAIPKWIESSQNLRRLR